MLRIYTLGGLRITHHNRPISLSARRAEVLLAYLAITKRAHERESLGTLLWDDRTQKQTKANLRSLLAQMPAEIKECLLATRNAIGLKHVETTGSIWVDALAFEAASTEIGAQGDFLAHYKGDFLAGVFIADSRGLEEWIAVTRERLRQVALAAHETAAKRALYARDYATGITHAQALVALDPLRETGQRLLMRLLVRDGHGNAALQQYQRLVALLNEELGVPPSAETERLFQRIESSRQQKTVLLPAQFTPFIGREKELAQIAKRFDDNACRLQTLHGAGGSGKTRLALAAAESLANDFMHGVRFVSLVSAEKGTNLLLTIANQLDLALGSDKPIIDQIAAQLAEQELLLLLDNAEHVVSELQPLLDTLLRRLPHLRVLVTSRSRLQLSAEWVLPLDGLAYASGEGEAAQFFISCARRHSAKAVGDAAAIEQICQLLQGMPLGIELAAAAMPQLSAAQIAQAIASNLDTLATAQYGVPDRHRSLRAAFNYSWQLLKEQEQQLLMRLSVFRAGFDLRAVESVTGLGQALAALVDKSLVQALGKGRYALHPAIQQFSAELLATSHQMATTSSAHSRHYGSLLAELSEQLKDERQITALAITESAEANLEQGWRYAVAQADWPTIEGYLFPLHKHYEAKSRYAQAADLFASAVANLRRQPHPNHRVLGSLLGNLGFHHERVGRLDEADAAFDQATAYLADTDAQDQMLTIFAHRGAIQYDRGNLAAAKEIYKTASQLARRIEDGRALAHCLSFLGYIEGDLGDWEAAEKNLRESIATWRSEGTPRGLVIALNGLAELYERQGKRSQARAIYAENLLICRDVGDAMGEARTLQNIGMLALEDGDSATARQHLEQALAVNDAQINNRWLDCFLSTRLAQIALADHAFDEAKRLYQHALAYTSESDDKRGSATALVGLGRVALAQNAFATAATHLRASLTLTLATDWLPMTLDALLYLAQVEAAIGDKGLASDTLWLVLAHDTSNAQSRAMAQSLLEKMGEISAESAPTLATILSRYAID